MTMKNKLCLLAILTACMLLLSGCQLAREESGDAAPDTLIGVFLTWDYLDLFDSEAYLQDNINAIVRGKNVQTDGAPYQGRLYATYLDKRDFIFENVAGMNYFAPVVSDEYGTYHLLCTDEGISGGDRHIHTTDEGTRVTMSGTIYVAPRKGDRTLYQNYVYQTPEGDVYVTSGSGMGFGENVGEFSFTTDESATVTNTDGKKESYSCSIEITVKEMAETDTITVLQLDSNHAVISQSTHSTDVLPDSVTPDVSCAYILMEAAGESGVTRTLFQPLDEGMTAYRPREDGVMVGHYIRLLWPETTP